jgi:hypothetical protein
MKTIIEFNLPEEKEELQAALNGSLYKDRIDELYDRVFRPHFKYDKPILPKDDSGMQELTDEQLAVIEQLWENVRQHFEDVLSD